MVARRSPEPLTRISVFLYDRQLEALNRLNVVTGVPVSVLIRQGVDRVLESRGITTSKAPKPGRRTRQ